MTTSLPAATLRARHEPHAPSLETVRAAVERATRAVAPLWPLERFVAVNPFLGLAEQPFAEAAGTMARVAGARLTMPRAFYGEQLRAGRIGDAHLAQALASARARAPHGALPADVDALRALALAGAASPAPARVPTVADVVGTLTGHDWSAIATERLSAWAAAYFDAGQASWRSPWRDLPAWRAWRAEAGVDRTPEVLGARGFRATVRRLPDDALAATAQALATLGVPEAGVDAYLHRLLMTVSGWAAFARHRLWEQELHGGRDESLAGLLAARLAWEVALLEAFAAEGAAAAWRSARAATVPAHTAGDDAIAIDVVLQEAYDLAWRERLVQRVDAGAGAVTGAARAERPAVQAVFCIDVRSEPYRRALEGVDAGIETLGFAGFFGFAIEHVPLGQATGAAQCPVLLAPGKVVGEGVVGDEGVAARAAAARLASRRAGNAWQSFKTSAIACFGFVEAVGLSYARKLLTDSLGMTRPVPHPSRDGIAADVRLRPRIDAGEVAGRAAGIAPAERLTMAASVLRGMSLTRGHARLVVLAGHGSSTVNNAHASGLDCGACGGNTGEANARVAAAVLNDPAVRAGLPALGITVPDDTVFVAALHDTTTDDVTLLDADLVPASHAVELECLRESLASASRLARARRAPRMGIAPADAERAIPARARDWSQVRPEWGLAGCAAFIAAPRSRTAGVDLEGRAFLHSYDWRDDAGFGVLELIMTAPMVVGSWISLQYYASTVDNVAFGSGTKVLHNVVGTIGVLEGSGGDLRTGLAWQSVHDGERLVHEPLRLAVIVEAPAEAMNAVIAKHAHVRALLDNGWLALFRMDDAGRVAERYDGGQRWVAVS